MSTKDKLLLYLVSCLLFSAGVLLCSLASAQTLPIYANQHAAYWYGQYLDEQARATGLEQSGKVAIDGLKASLRAANDTIVKQNGVIVRLVGERNAQTDRAARAETALAPTKSELDTYKGRTVAGKFIRKVGDGLRYVGGITLLVIALKATL